ncbi:OCIA domain-containing protein 2, partial [Eschrichtius robustus]|nr:OCIA domain-containing protein 2 [Eschrichtius robustus]
MGTSVGTSIILPTIGYLAANPRFGSLPKVALAGVLGFGLGKASYIRVCQSKFHSFEGQLRGAGFGPGHN